MRIGRRPALQIGLPGVHAVSAVNYLSAAARRTKLLALAAKLRSWRRATRLALAVIVALAALSAALYSPLQAYV